MRILKICLGLIIVALGVFVFNTYKSDDLSLEKESFMDTIFEDEKPIKLVFEDYVVESKIEKYSEKISSKPIGNEIDGFKIYKDSANVYGVDVNRKLKLFNIKSTSVINEKCEVSLFTNVLGKSGVKFSLVDDSGVRTLYFYENTEENTMVLLADELHANEMYLGNEYLSIVTEDGKGLINSIITKDSTELVKKANIEYKKDDAIIFELKANYDEESFMYKEVNKHGYTQTSPYVFENSELQPSFMPVDEEAEIENIEVENKEVDNTEIISEDALKLVYPLQINDKGKYTDFVSNNGDVFDGTDNAVNIDEESSGLYTATSVTLLDGSTKFKVEESYRIANRVNSSFTKLTGYIDENANDGFTYEYYKINDNYYVVRNVEHNNYCFINADGSKVTSFRFYNEPKAFGEYIFVQDDKEAYFLNSKLEKASNLPSLKGYYTLKSYEEAFVNESTTSNKVFVTSVDGELIHETDNSYEYETYKYNDLDEYAVEGTDRIYTIKYALYNANFNYNSEYVQITGLENIVAEEEINHTLKKYAVKAVDEYKKNTDEESILLNSFFVFQETEIENKILKIKQIETLKDNKSILASTEKYFYFDMATGKEIFIKDIFKKGYEVRLLEELNFIVNNENTKLKVDIDKVGEFELNSDLYVTYKKGEIGTGDVGYIIELPLENLADVVDFEGNTYKSFSANYKTFTGFVTNQSRSLMFVESKDFNKVADTKYISVSTKYPQFASNGTDSYNTINEYYKKQFEEDVVVTQTDLSNIVFDTSVEFTNYYLSEKLLQNKSLHGYVSANYNKDFINDLWNVETGEKLDLYSLFDLEPEETEEFLDQIIYDEAKVFYDSKDYDETSDRKYGLLDIYRTFTNESGERKTEVGTRAIDVIDFNNDWYLTTEGLVLVYQEYVLSGNGSAFKLLIPYEKISDKLNEELKNELKLKSK